MECKICELMDENGSTTALINECLSMLTNETSAKLLSKYFDTTVTASQIIKHKGHSVDWIPIREKIANLDWSSKTAIYEYAALDGLRGIITKPGRTSPYAMIQAVDSILKAQEAERNTDAASTYNIIEEVKSVVLEETAEVPEVRAKIANRLDGVIHRCLEAGL